MFLNMVKFFNAHFSLYFWLMTFCFFPPNFKLFILYWGIANSSVVVVSGEQ